jgi:hypothetical protein
MTWQRVRTGGVYLRLSLVTCPVVLYPASSQNEKIHFHQINRKTGNRLHQQMVDERTGKVVDKTTMAVATSSLRRHQPITNPRAANVLQKTVRSEPDRFQSVHTITAATNPNLKTCIAPPRKNKSIRTLVECLAVAK